MVFNFKIKHSKLVRFEKIAACQNVATRANLWRYHHTVRHDKSWWRHQMETFSTLLAIRMGNSPVPGDFLAQGLVTRPFDVLFDLRPNKRLSKQSWDWRFERPSRSLWRHCNVHLWFLSTSAIGADGYCHPFMHPSVRPERRYRSNSWRTLAFALNLVGQCTVP